MPLLFLENENLAYQQYCQDTAEVRPWHKRATIISLASGLLMNGALSN